MNERIFYLEQNIDLSEMIAMMKSAKADTVVFVLPRKSTLFESIVNLQIIRSEAEENGKELIIITMLAQARKMCEIVGIESHPTLEHWEKKVPGHTVTAKKNEPEDYSHVSKIRRVPIVVAGDGEEPQNAVEEDHLNWKEVLSRPSWEALFGLLVFSMGLFFFLSFLAFPGATIEIKPEKKVIEAITNMTLYNVEQEENQAAFHTREGISGYPVESVFEKQMEFSTVSKEFRGTNSSGELIVFNTYLEERRLRPTTRFQTAEGIVFRTEDWVVVPPASYDEEGRIIPGKRIAAVVADEQDVYGRFVGEMGNIPASTFFLPGLPEAARDNIWAESQDPFTGGRTDWIPKVAQVDIDAAKNKITADLLESAREDLEKFIAEKNARDKTDLELLIGEDFIEAEVIEVNVDESIIGEELSSFPVSAKLKVRTWAYSKGELFTVLWEELAAKTDPKMHLVGLDEESIYAQLLERGEGESSLKLSLSVRGAQEYVIDPKSETGILFVNEIKNEIAGMNRDDAEGVLGNREEVSEVHISLWPFWSQKIPKLPENISIKLVSSMEEDFREAN